ncbi:MAG: DUF3857 domain-containing protein [Armatimonadia bacterium]|nr:DUF3857 domain-containing protein [Armatimonadia bacterium]
MTRTPAAITGAFLLGLVAAACAHEGPVYNYPVTVDDVTINQHNRSVVCDAKGAQTILIEQTLTINSRRAAEEFVAPSVSWRDGSAAASLGDVTVRRDGRTVFHLGPRPDGPDIALTASDDGVGPMRRAEVPLPELQSGDVVEWAVELRRKPLIEGHIFAQMAWSAAHPVEQGRFSLQAPRDTKLQSRSWGPVGEPLVVPEDDHKTWLWRVEQTIKPIQPTEGQILPQTIVSTAHSWDVVAEWLRARLMASGGELGDGEGAELVASVADLSHRERVQGVLDHVRESLLLPHVKPWNDPFTARTPAAVLESGIGDCKDRAWLIYRVLQEAGLTPHLAVTGLSRGIPPLSEQPPNPLLFDHVLAGASGPGTTIWLDPTGAAEEQLDRGQTLDALVLGEERAPTVPIDRLHRPTGPEVATR